VKEELDKALVGAFPLLYRDRHGSPYETCMCWGFPGDGWFDLLWDLSCKLEPLIRAWIDEHGPDGHPAAAQVKEKFGTLRFYMTCATDEMYDLIAAAERESATTCEDCGEPGKRRSGGWILTLCDACHAAQEARRRKAEQDF
jgi:hypothetical protein